MFFAGLDGQLFSLSRTWEKQKSKHRGKERAKEVIREPAICPERERQEKFFMGKAKGKGCLASKKEGLTLRLAAGRTHLHVCLAGSKPM